ncbi:MAG TPA: nucleotidyltransferase family protein [Thermoanaerobaculia bacterium]|nr:nucleotidyltransferase family protein [Thermoanaerobaculia bacterium]
MTATARKAVILARGLGTRMRREDPGARLDPEQEKAAGSGVKAMISFGGGRPFLDYVLSGLADAGLHDACLVIGPEHQEIRRYYGETSPPRRLRVAFAVQREPRGTADAVLAAEEFAAGEGFLVINSDNLYPVSALADLTALPGPGVSLFERKALLSKGNIPAERIAAFAVCVVSPDGDLESIIEKPDSETLARLGDDSPVSMNCWRFSPAIFEACRNVPRSPRGEYELPEAVRLAIKSGARFRVVRSAEGVLDLSQRSDIRSVGEKLRNASADP